MSFHVQPCDIFDYFENVVNSTKAQNYTFFQLLLLYNITLKCLKNIQKIIAVIALNEEYIDYLYKLYFLKVIKIFGIFLVIVMQLFYFSFFILKKKCLK